jgi:molybdopterin synthase catalytic subunit
MLADLIRVQTDDFDVAHEYQRLAGQPQLGAVVMFVGQVRDLSDTADLRALYLEHYPAMTERALRNIVQSVRERWQLDAVTIIHRVGQLAPAEQIVLVITASQHRAAAYAANSYLMDLLKTEAPFWKKEITQQGEYWVDAKVSDEQARASWQD